MADRNKHLLPGIVLDCFKKFFVWLRDADRISPEVVDDILTMIKEDRQDFLEAVEDDAW